MTGPGRVSFGGGSDSGSSFDSRWIRESWISAAPLRPRVDVCRRKRNHASLFSHWPGDVIDDKCLVFGYWKLP